MKRAGWITMAVLVLAVAGRLYADDAAALLFGVKGPWGMAETGLEAKAGMFILKQESDTGKEAVAEMEKLRDLLEKAPKDAELLRSAIERTLWQFYGQKGCSRSAAQVSQLAGEAQVRLALIQVQQNRRIIELLEQMAASRGQAKKEGGAP